MANIHHKKITGERAIAKLRSENILSEQKQKVLIESTRGELRHSDSTQTLEPLTKRI